MPSSASLSGQWLLQLCCRKRRFSTCVRRATTETLNMTRSGDFGVLSEAAWASGPQAKGRCSLGFSRVTRRLRAHVTRDRATWHSGCESATGHGDKRTTSGKRLLSAFSLRSAQSSRHMLARLARAPAGREQQARKASFDTASQSTGERGPASILQLQQVQSAKEHKSPRRR